MSFLRRLLAALRALFARPRVITRPPTEAVLESSETTIKPEWRT